MSEKSKFLRKFKVLNGLKDNFINEINILHIFKNRFIEKINLFIITKDDKVFAFGYNANGVLGFGHNRDVKELTFNEELSNKTIIEFKNNDFHAIAQTIDGKVYCWGCGEYRLLDNGSVNFKVFKPKLIQYFCNENIFVIYICCGAYHSLVLTSDGEVYSLVSNSFRVETNEDFVIIPIKVKGLDGNKVDMISCGESHSMALTKNGRVFSWGSNSFGQLGHNNTEDSEFPKIIALKDNMINIIKISCGPNYSLLLSSDGDIYFFGDDENENGIQFIPRKININENKFIDISTHSFYNISIALSKNGVYFFRGRNGREVITNFQETDFSSFNEIFVNFLQITYNSLYFEMFGTYIRMKSLDLKSKTIPKLDKNQFIYDGKRALKLPGAKPIRSHIENKTRLSNSLANLQVLDSSTSKTNEAKSGIDQKNSNQTNIVSSFEIKSKSFGSTVRNLFNQVFTPRKTTKEKVEKKYQEISQSKFHDKNETKEYSVKNSGSISALNTNIKENKESKGNSSSYKRYEQEFKELELIGSGSFGKVYKVINFLDRQHYAVKKINFEGI
jgi:alpha-tubulin suppressor-like RCC1 family protein